MREQPGHHNREQSGPQDREQSGPQKSQVLEQRSGRRNREQTCHQNREYSFHQNRRMSGQKTVGSSEQSDIKTKNWLCSLRICIYLSLSIQYDRSFISCSYHLWNVKCTNAVCPRMPHVCIFVTKMYLKKNVGGNRRERERERERERRKKELTNH